MWLLCLNKGLSLFSHGSGYSDLALLWQKTWKQLFSGERSFFGSWFQAVVSWLPRWSKQHDGVWVTNRDVYGVAGRGRAMGSGRDSRAGLRAEQRHMEYLRRSPGNKNFRFLLSDEPSSSHGLTFHNNTMRFLSHQWLNPLLKLELSGSTTSQWLGRAFCRWTFWETLYI